MVQKIIFNLSTRSKNLIVFLFDSFCVLISFFLAFELRLNDIYLDQSLIDSLFAKFLIILPFQMTCFYLFGLYRGIWRFSSTPDLLRIIKAVSVSIPLSFLALFIFQKIEGVPRSIFFIQWALLIIFIGGGRFAYRLYRDMTLSLGNIKEKQRTLILGAGYSAQILIREIKSDLDTDINVIGLLDDDIEKRKRILHGYKVLGGISDISQIAKKYKVTDVIISIPSASREELKRIVGYCNDTNLKVRTIPSLADIINGKVQITKLKKVSPEDLLGRDQVNLDLKSISHMLSKKIILVTGAGGSIGSELCHQILKFKPKKLICFDMSEYNLYQLESKFEKNEFSEIEFIVGDVRDSFRVESIFDSFRPEIVFHAAAYKHVPMMEKNPIEAIKVNIVGTQTVAMMADKYSLDRFVLISTDKAVNPTNVMGATKRVAEIVCQEVQKNSKTKFNVVRFGNVLGSSGSVIPRFQKQIEVGGPITVTHPDIIRYFMSIPEAAQLVIQAGALGNGGEIFVLDMGEPVKIIDLAKQMITLAGLKLNHDIKIEFTGLRPGEKLYEELLSDKETTLPTMNERVRVAKVACDIENLNEFIISLINPQNDNKTLIMQLKKLVPEFKNSSEITVESNQAYS